MVVSQVVRAAPQGTALPSSGLLRGLAGRDPRKMLAPAGASGLASRLSLLEVGSMGCVVALLSGFYAFGLLYFGIKEMIFSGTPLLGGYLLLLLLGLALFRGFLDRLLAPIHRLLAQIPPMLRMLAGFALPLFWVLVDSRDLGHGFLHAGITVTIATGLAHVLFSSLRTPQPVPQPGTASPPVGIFPQQGPPAPHPSSPGPHPPSPGPSSRAGGA
ncbi:MAG: hypothetical protein ACOX9B_02940 [Candidatus Xenobium sp.]